VRLDAEALRALAQLEATGLSRSEAIRRAILESAARLQRRAALAAEVAALEADEDDRLGETARVLVEQVGAVDAGRLGELVDRVSPEQQWGIDDALMTVLGLR
jgi:mRNA-degrading endonuclease toxin of MazEF toxin-antitoxin module